MSMLKLSVINETIFEKWMKNGMKRVPSTGGPSVGDSVMKYSKPKGWGDILRKLIKKPKGLRLR